jgi:hypothetical protein
MPSSGTRDNRRTSAHSDLEGRTVQRLVLTKGAKPRVKLKLPVQIRMVKTFAASRRLGFPSPVLHVCPLFGKMG